MVVGNDDLGIARRQIAGFRDHPDPGFRPIGSGNDATDVFLADLLGMCGHRRKSRKSGRQHHGKIIMGQLAHCTIPPGNLALLFLRRFQDFPPPASSSQRGAASARTA